MSRKESNQLYYIVNANTNRKIFADPAEVNVVSRTANFNAVFEIHNIVLIPTGNMKNGYIVYKTKKDKRTDKKIPKYIILRRYK